MLVTAFSDVVDENDRFREGGYLTQLGRTLGVWLEDFGALALPGGPGQAHAPFTGEFGQADGTLLAEEIHLAGAQALGTYTGGRLDGRPAFTVNSVGGGRAYYLSTCRMPPERTPFSPSCSMVQGSYHCCPGCHHRSRSRIAATC